MRDIKFRAFKKESGGCENCWADLHGGCSDFCKARVGTMLYDIAVPFEGTKYGWELMQFTGLKDRHGKEIYEGDIVRSWRSKNDTEPWLDKVVWDKKTATYQMVGDSNTDLFWYSARERPSLDTCEVIGNIYENPELLEEKK